MREKTAERLIDELARLREALEQAQLPDWYKSPDTFRYIPEPWVPVTPWIPEAPWVPEPIYAPVPTTMSGGTAP